MTKKILATRPGKTIYKDGDYLVKQFDESYSKPDILNEALNQARVEVTDIHMPHLKAVETVEGKWSIVSDFIEGVTLASLMEQNPKKMDEYLNLFVDLQISTLSHSVPMLNNLKDKMNSKISQSANMLDATTRYDLHTRLDSMPTHKNLCHGDFNPTNIIITKDGTPYIIDWAHVTQGNASADVARSYLLFYLSKKSEVGEKYLSLYCKKSDTALQYVQKWIPIIAASRLVKAPKSEYPLLLSWIDVVDYE